MNKSSKVLLRLLFLLYAGAMLWLLFGQRISDEGITISLSTNGDNLNLIPLKTVKLYIGLLKNSGNKALLRHAVINLVGNVVLFIPLGWFLPYNWEKFHGFFRTLLTVVVLIFAVELVQYFTQLGSCDIDDLILNFAGAMAGYILWKIGTYRQSKK